MTCSNIKKENSMNIAPNFQTLKLPAVVQQRQNSPRAFLKDNNQDSFVHSTPSFKGGRIDALKIAAQNILKNPEMTTTIFTLIGVAEVLNHDAAQKLIDVIKGIQEDDEKINQDDILTNEDITINVEDKTAITDNKNPESVKFEYKRTKKPNANDLELEKNVNGLCLTQEYNEKLQDICLKLQKINDFYMINNKSLNTKDITPMFNEELTNAKKEGQSAILEIIDNYSSYMKAPVQAENNPKTKIETSLIKPKLLGKIDLGSVDPRYRETPVAITEQIEGKESYKLIFPGTVNSSQYAFDIIFINALKKIKETNPEVDNPRITRKTNIIRANKKDVINEIARREKKGNPYLHINRDNADEIAYILSSGKFKNLFSLHSSMRFIDKFVNFDSNVSLEDQCDVLIEKLEEAIKQTCSKGLNFQILEQKLKTKHMDGSISENTAYVPTFIIKPEELSKDVQDALGSLPIRVMLCKVYQGDRGHKGILCTIFPLEANYSVEDEL